MNYLERITENHKGFFVDLFVRASNPVAIGMY
jgi:ribosomal protein S18 acetylase RimI-like enzyme